MSERKLEKFFKFKEGANFNRRNTLSILRIALKLHCVPKFKPDAKIGKISSFRSGTNIDVFGIFLYKNAEHGTVFLLEFDFRWGMACGYISL